MTGDNELQVEGKKDKTKGTTSPVT